VQRVGHFDVTVFTAKLADIVLDDANGRLETAPTRPLPRGEHLPGDEDARRNRLEDAVEDHARTVGDARGWHLEIAELTFYANDPTRAGLTKQRRDLDDKDPF
jgi:hypothetical protein